MEYNTSFPSTNWNYEFSTRRGEITRSANIKLDTGCGADLVITKEIANALNLGDEDFVV